MESNSGLKSFLDCLKDNQDLLHVPAPVDARFEISAILSQWEKKNGPALFFEKVKGQTLPVVGNILGTRSRLCLALGLDPAHFPENIVPKLEQRIDPVLRAHRSSDEMIIKKEKIDLTRLLPILTYYAKDSGAYITSGITSAKDRALGVTVRGLHRMEVRGRNELGISLLSPPLSETYARCKKEKKKLEIATVIGVDPTVLVSAILKVPPGVDKLALAGGLKGKPIPLIHAETVDVDIPADAEVTIEGFISPRGREEDGVMGESSGYYMTFPSSPTVHVTAIKIRKDACYHAILPWGLEVDNLLFLIHGMEFIPKMKSEVPSIRDIHFVPGTFATHVVMSLDTDDKGEIRRALTLALSFSYIKKAIAVDTDIDPSYAQEVEWALASRFQAHKDLILLQGIRGYVIDPSCGESFSSSKIGMDATRPRKAGFEKVDVSEQVRARVSPILKSLARKNRP
jgi:2,5-furandicarboxylate decarboxylase 1